MKNNNGNGITSWSYSRYTTYKQCPRKAKFTMIDKIKEPKSPAMERGIKVHTDIEHYIKGTMRELTPEALLLKREIKALKELHNAAPNKVHVEDSWAFRKDWSLTRFNDWAGCWLRVKLDAGHYEGEHGTTYIVTDWKTGRFYPNDVEAYVQQLEIYALGAFLQMPWIDTVKCRLAYVDSGTFYPNEDGTVFERDQLESLKALWVKRVAPMFKDKDFAPRPNDKCKWCFFSHQNGGTCEF